MEAGQQDSTTRAAEAAGRAAARSAEREQRFVELISDEVHAQAWRYCLRLCSRREDAEDLLQDALGLAYRKLEQLREPALAGAWLMSIVRRRYIRLWQREQSRPPQVDELPEIGTDNTADPLAELVQAALARLPLPQRELLELYYIEGLDMQECGTVLGIGPRVVKQRIYRARQAMRRLYSPRDAAAFDSAAGGMQ